MPLSRTTVADWLEGLGVPYVSSVELTDLDYEWALRIGEEDGPQVLAVQQGKEFNNVRLQTSINVSTQHREVLRSVGEDVRDAFYHDLRITLLQQPIGSSLSFLEDEPGILADFTIGINLLDDQVTRSVFFRRHHQVRSATTLAVVMIQKIVRFETWQ